MVIFNSELLESLPEGKNALSPPWGYPVLGGVLSRFCRLSMLTSQGGSIMEVALDGLCLREIPMNKWMRTGGLPLFLGHPHMKTMAHL